MDEPKVAVLRHYASPYYDPQKAHEYYMRTRELKGRSTTLTINISYYYKSLYCHIGQRDYDMRNLQFIRHNLIQMLAMR